MVYSHTEIMVVMGYGCHLTPVLKEYLDQAVAYAKSNPHSIIFCTGGFTNSKTAPGVCEAGLMADYLRQQGVCNYIIQDRDSRTTTENLRSLRQYADLRIESLERIVVFCDSCRSLKIRLIFHHLFGFWPEIFSFDITQKWQSKVIQYTFSTPLDLFGLYWPIVEKMEILVRRISITRK